MRTIELIHYRYKMKFSLLYNGEEINTHFYKKSDYPDKVCKWLKIVAFNHAQSDETPCLIKYKLVEIEE